MRCFVAVVPPSETAAHIEQCVNDFSRALPALSKARRIATADLHLTLAFLGTIQPEKTQEIAAALAQLEPHHFPAATWTLDRVGWFKGARALWLGGALAPALQYYVDAVRSTLSRLNTNFDTRPFVPHVTIFRNVKSHAPSLETQISVSWPLSRPVLMESLPTTCSMRYHLVEPHS